MKIILNKTYGGFDVSQKAYELYAEKKGLELFKYSSDFNFEKVTYTKIEDANEAYLFCEYFTKDFGEKANISNEDYVKYNLFLNEKHRTDEVLIEVIEELSKEANGRFGDLKIVEIPDGAYYKVEEYDGYESLYYSMSEIFEK